LESVRHGPRGDVHVRDSVVHIGDDQMEVDNIYGSPDARESISESIRHFPSTIEKDGEGDSSSNGHLTLPSPDKKQPRPSEATMDDNNDKLEEVEVKVEDSSFEIIMDKNVTFMTTDKKLTRVEYSTIVTNYIIYT